LRVPRLEHAVDLQPGTGADANLIHIVLGDVDASAQDAQVRNLEEFGASSDVGSQAIGHPRSEHCSRDEAPEFLVGSFRGEDAGLQRQTFSLLGRWAKTTIAKGRVSCAVLSYDMVGFTVC
jgi:hypothetical protein